MPVERARPFVSCIMPTFNRRAVIRQAIHYFFRQDYRHSELIVVDDGTDPVVDLMPVDDRVRYIRLSDRNSVGAKRNWACEQARGSILLHWDDDDWHAPNRIRSQVELLQRSGADVCGIQRQLYYDPSARKAWTFAHRQQRRPWPAGASLCYTRDFWARARFADLSQGEDAHFLKACDVRKLVMAPDANILVGLLHPYNAGGRSPKPPFWQPYSRVHLETLLGADLAFYHPFPKLDGQVSIPTPRVLDITRPDRRMFAITYAREADLELPEFIAYNQIRNQAGNLEQALPRMRRWEFPFALFQAQLSNTMSVLDCSANPGKFGERLSLLYPHVLYRKFSPIQDNQFVLPLGQPDDAFDRIFCINTLEHLLKPQREELIAAMVKKLKPGGRLILTSDFYFDSAWQNPAFLGTGFMRADKQEVFGGFNKVTPEEWLTVCRRAGLEPWSSEREEPREGEAGLYLNTAPLQHTTIGGVFYKPPRMAMSSRRVVLALLTWNKREVSVDSVRAYVTEARMLRRLGHQPFLCVCDNGSTDGLPAALKALEPQIDIPHRFIFNRENLGNSIARNQILDYMIECDADYLLYMDGDIEVVPFSSFAMLRYMENCGYQLGCIGADSRGQNPFRSQASKAHFSVQEGKIQTTDMVAWTQYGMFRRAIFDEGVRFDETPPFNGAGWGFEDNDLAFQMAVRGFINQHFFGMVYLHRDLRSSVKIMRETGIDANALYERRRQYVLKKWDHIPRINSGPLNVIRGMASKLY